MKKSICTDRATVQVAALPLNALIEIEAIASGGEKVISVST